MNKNISEVELLKKDMIKKIICLCVIIILSYALLSPSAFFRFAGKERWQSKSQDITFNISETYEEDLSAIKLKFLKEEDTVKNFISSKTEGEFIKNGETYRFRMSGQTDDNYFCFGSSVDEFGSVWHGFSFNENEPWLIKGKFYSLFFNKALLFVIDDVEGDVFPKDKHFIILVS